jgi:hypothetical protein
MIIADKIPSTGGVPARAGWFYELFAQPIFLCPQPILLRLQPILLRLTKMPNAPLVVP